MRLQRTPLINISAVTGITDPQDFIPERKSPDAVGYDVKACQVLDPWTREVIQELSEEPVVTIKPGEVVLIGCGYIAAIPKGVDCQVRPRSGLAVKHHIILANGPGTVDPDFRGQIGCLLYNVDVDGKSFDVKWKDRIAQIVFAPILMPEFRFVKSVEQLHITERGTGGFGSSGMAFDEGLGTDSYKTAIRKQDIAFLEIAHLWGKHSTCVRGCPMDEKGVPLKDEKGKLKGATRQIGCVIAVNSGIVASGYNEQYPGADACKDIGCIREKLKIPSGQQLEICQAIHAEDMAMINALAAGTRIDGGVMYCTAEPCKLCARKISALPLDALVVIRGGYSSSEGVEMVRGAGIIVREIPIEEITGSL